MFRKLICITLAVLMLGLLCTSCGKKDENLEKVTLVEEETNIVVIQVEDFGTIVLELYPEVAPITVANFKKLVSQNFYDGLIFHRVISGFMIQGGDPRGNGTGGSDEEIFGEFSANGFENNLSHTRGVLSMARATDPNSASSQFFIMHQDYTYLDGDYAAFGKVLYGMEVVDAIAAVDTNSSDKPLNRVVMTSVDFAILKDAQ